MQPTQREDTVAILVLCLRVECRSYTAFGGGIAGSTVNSCRAVIRNDGELSVIVFNWSCYMHGYIISQLQLVFNRFFLLYGVFICTKGPKL